MPTFSLVSENLIDFYSEILDGSMVRVDVGCFLQEALCLNKRTKLALEDLELFGTA